MKNVPCDAMNPSAMNPGAMNPGAMKLRVGRRGLRTVLWGLAAVAALGVACSDDDPADGGGECIGGEGAIAGAADTHCTAEDGTAIVQAVGACRSAAELEDGSEKGEEGEEHEHEEGEEDGHAILSGREADDDDCKYRVRFENSCVAVNQPVTFTLSLTRKMDGMPGTGANPESPEIFLDEDGVTHISPSNDITAREGPAGTYEIGPVIFDRSGRWVVRFHYFATCSEIPEDSPHGHVAFYIDVP